MRRIAPLLACLILALVPATAEGKKKHKKHPRLGPVVTVTATGNKVSSAGEESTALATCPPGKQVIGGGFSAPANANAALIVHNSFRISPDSWRTDARYISGTVPGAVTAYAYCRNATRIPISDVAQGTTLSDSNPTTLAPTCPPGTRLVGGGFQSVADSDTNGFAIIEQNAPGPGSATWSVTAQNLSSTPRDLAAHAYCLAGIRAPIVLARNSSSTVRRNETITGTTDACPTPPKPKKGKKRRRQEPQLLSAGGFNGPVFRGPGDTLVLWSNSLWLPPGWKAEALNADPVNMMGGSVSITSYGVCV